MRFFRKEDIRAVGSGNIGATNVVRSGAKGLGVLTLLLDLAKGLVAVLMARHFAPGAPGFPSDLAVMAAVMAVVGHVFPVWLGFKGGKGVATALGVFLGLAWPLALALVAVFIVLVLISRIVSLASIVAAALLPGVRDGVASGSFGGLSGWCDLHCGAGDCEAPCEYSAVDGGERKPLWGQEGAGMSRIAVLGAGAWGTALAISLARRGGHQLTLWAHSGAHAEELADSGENLRYLPGFVLPADVRVTARLTEAIEGADVILCVTPAQALRSVMEAIAPSLKTSQVLLSASKGIEEKTFLRMAQVAAEHAPENPFGTLGGPSFAQEVAAAMPTAITIATEEDALGKRLQDDFTSPSLRVYRNQDVIGTELGGALKNVIALAAGVVTGLELGANSGAALITRGMAEITRLAMACGGRRETLAGLSGMGDLVLTCTGGLSRNRTVGVELGKGRHLPEILAGLKGKVAEGVRSTTAALGLAARYGVEMPITEQMAAILHEDKPPREAIRELMARPGRTE